ncbi:uncharacterized protein CCOS01_14854 [Colletotrichum costaricense]|uniref:Uncharacterized protein n=1 Tax=Colletotrichum costaricense TaxID=1209916 RepID=A0AAJ0DTM0_9PEZI|nr:uncharacterized protein CCOS01_14854 [Colletotrichum costaricense]KAK1511092.1 hypothetical protein CCOS01_14854 [Colletotrichum costaricense]
MKSSELHPASKYSCRSIDPTAKEYEVAPRNREELRRQNSNRRCNQEGTENVSRLGQGPPTMFLILSVLEAPGWSFLCTNVKNWHTLASHSANNSSCLSMTCLQSHFRWFQTPERGRLRAKPPRNASNTTEGFGAARRAHQSDSGRGPSETLRTWNRCGSRFALSEAPESHCQLRSSPLSGPP